MTKNINQVYENHIKYLNQNEFIYEVKASYDLLSEDKKKIYRLGFINGCKEMQERKRPVQVAPPNKKIKRPRQLGKEKFFFPPNRSRKPNTI